MPDVLDVEVIRQHRVARDVSQRGKRRRCDKRAANGQAIETVGQIDRVRGSDNNDPNNEQKRQISEEPERCRKQPVDEQIGSKRLEERNRQRRDVQLQVRQVQEINADADGDQSLESDLFASREAKRTAPDNFQIIVRESNGAKRKSRENGNPDVACAQIRPQQCG